ncbi:hypothetical protein LKV13_01775 [Borrelia sp. BU AG58]|uniref:hypothetical protein n=1 Tax=Borrelia sp. BU AG58 TaxID=2887345 RepID=UPI001E3F8E53|nr:hypothetical protein [Borrelia sp. BU AG58]UER67535.1 hypothetical protein LKV13_01775 [Borrelia sp. BU AG58]
MFDVLRSVFLVSCRFVFVFFVLSFVFLCTFYLKYKFLYVNFSVFSYELYHDAYLYAFPLALVFTFMRISYPFNAEAMGMSRVLCFVTFVSILVLSYFGFKAAYDFNTIFVGFHQKSGRTIRDGIVHFFDDKLVLYSDDSKQFGFKGLLKVERNDDDGDFSGFSYAQDFPRDNIVYSKKDVFLMQRIYSKLISYVFNDLETLNNFFLSLGHTDLIFNAFGFGLLLFSFFYIFNLIFSSSFSLFLYPIFVFLFFKVYNLYAVEFPKNFDSIMGRSLVSDYIPFVFCVLTFFSVYLFGFIASCIKVGEGFDTSLLK